MRPGSEEEGGEKEGRQVAIDLERELIDTGTNKLFVRRNAAGGTSFSEVVDVSKSLAADRRTKAKKVAKSGQGDRGDRKRR